MIAVDWGTSQLRAYRLDAAGKVVEARERPEGIMSVGQGAFPATLAVLLGNWADADEPILMSGMVGSRQGWIEVPYVACPAGLEEVAAGVRSVEFGQGSKALICPGLACRDEDGVPDVMRGEEVQIFGALALNAEEGAGSVLMAGTHCKHVRIEGGRIAGFATHMAGEVFAVLRQHSILGRTMAEAAGVEDDRAFADGVARSGEAGGLLHHLFGVRARALMGELPASAGADHLSGILVGHTIRAAAPEPPVLVMGAPKVAARYLRACALLGIEARTLSSEEATVAGLFRVAVMQRDRAT